MLRYDGWETVEIWLRTLPELDDGVWTYLTIADRTNRDAEVSLGRRAREGDGDPFENTPDDLVTWVREQANGNSLGSRHTVFRLRTWTKLGSSNAGSRQFVVQDETAPDAMDSYLNMSPGQAEQHATVAGLRHVGDHYKQFGDTVLAAVKGLADIFTGTASQLNAELNTQRSQALGLFRAQMQDKRETSEQDALLAIHTADSKVKEAALNRGLSMLEKVGGIAFAPDKTPDELKALLQVIGGSPELSKTLKDPKVLDLLRQPEAQKGIAEILKDLATPDAPAPDEEASDEGNDDKPPLRAVPDNDVDEHPSLSTAEPEAQIAGDETAATPPAPTEDP